MKMKPKGRRFETVSDIQRESQSVLDNIKEKTPKVLLKREKNDVIIYIPKETILKEVVAKIKLSQHLFFDLVRELSDSTSYYLSMSIVTSHWGTFIGTKYCSGTPT
jgi:hypothetical protein